jgi:predicted ArsR family transcriptional regulator
MFSQALRDISRPTYAEILEALKRSDGMAVSELARELKMSYMGVKQHCVNLEKKGYLKTWRVPRTQVGRPEKLYRLTEACDELFPQAGPALTLNLLKGVKQLYGSSAPEKMLLHHFEDQRLRWSAKMKTATSLAEKASKLAELRDAEGCFSKCAYDSQSGLRIEEYHHPMAPIFAEYPSSIRMEVQMMERLLGSRMARKLVDNGKGRELVIYEVASLGIPTDRGVINGVQSAVNPRITGNPNKVPTFLEM